MGASELFDYSVLKDTDRNIAGGTHFQPGDSPELAETRRKLREENAARGYGEMVVDGVEVQQVPES